MSPKRNCKDSLLLDLDGPLLDVSERYYRVYKKIIEKIGGRPLNKKTYWGRKRKKSGLAEILEASAVSKNKCSFFRKEWLAYIEKRPYLCYDRVWPHTRGMLDKLRRRHRIILITMRRSPLNLNWQLRRLNLDGYFDSVLCRGNNQGGWRVKYDLVRTSGLRYPGSFLIGDTEIDILAGKKLGVKTIALLCGIRNKDILKDYKPEHIFNSLKELTRVLD